MQFLPNHSLPRYTEEARKDALFHYTTAPGLTGILTRNELWSTAYYCANDESELATGRGVLTPTFRSMTHRMSQEDHPFAQTFWSRGIDISTYADSYENRAIAQTLSALCAYIACFFVPAGEEDFLHGLLSQWRGYGSDGGYAIQFSRTRLEAALRSAEASHKLNYDLQDVYYTKENALKEALLKHEDKFRNAFHLYLEDLAKPLDFKNPTWRNVAADLFDGPLEALLDYLVHTKSPHFSEERECRLSIFEPVASDGGRLPVEYFSRNGLVVPYTKTLPDALDILNCIDWIVVGPAPRMHARFQSVCQLVKRTGRKIMVRPSHIPLVRQ